MHLSGLGLAYDLLHFSNSYLPDQPMTISNALRYLSLTLLVCFSGLPTFAQDKWMDWRKQSFQFDGRQAFVIVPQTPAEGIHGFGGPSSLGMSRRRISRC